MSINLIIFVFLLVNPPEILGKIKSHHSLKLPIQSEPNEELEEHGQTFYCSQLLEKSIHTTTNFIREIGHSLEREGKKDQSQTQDSEVIDNFNDEGDDWAKILTFVLFDVLIVILCSICLQCCLAFSRRCKANLSNYQRRLKWKKKYQLMKALHGQDPIIQLLSAQNGSNQFHGHEADQENKVDLNQNKS